MGGLAESGDLRDNQPMTLGNIRTQAKSAWQHLVSMYTALEDWLRPDPRVCQWCGGRKFVDEYTCGATACVERDEAEDGRI